MLYRAGKFQTLWGPACPIVKRSMSYSKVNDVEYHAKAKSVIQRLSGAENRRSRLILDRSSKFASAVKFQRVPSNEKTVVFAVDDFAGEAQCASVAAQLQASELQSFIMSPGERTVPADTYLLEDVINDRVASSIDHFKFRMHKFAEVTLNCKLKEAGTLLSWLSPPEATHKDSNSTETLSTIVTDVNHYNYWHAHCDKANNSTYDVSVLLYLNNDYTGGSLIFMDEGGQDSEVQPIAGRLLMFYSGVDNIHRIEPVKSGNRFLLSAWYSFAH